MSRVVAMSLDEAIRTRRSVRGFLPREVPDSLLREVFALAQWAPSNCNVQPWLPHVVSGAALARLRDGLVRAGAKDEPIAPDWPADGVYHGVYRERQVDAARALYGAMGVQRHDTQARRAAYAWRSTRRCASIGKRKAGAPGRGTEPADI